MPSTQRPAVISRAPFNLLAYSGEVWPCRLRRRIGEGEQTSPDIAIPCSAPVPMNDLQVLAVPAIGLIFMNLLAAVLILGRWLLNLCIASRQDLQEP